MTLGTRAAALERLAREPHWDVVVVGGGITGAGVLREAARRGLKVLLLEQRDYAWGTSSRSSKMVHGGLRYIAQGDFRLTRDALLERERMLREAPGLVERMGYLFPVRRGQFPGRWSFTALLALYDRLAGIRDHRWLNSSAVRARAPGLKADGLTGGCWYTDAVTDDARLVLRVLQDAVADGAVALNHAKVTALVRGSKLVTGVVVQDIGTGRSYTVNADVVINATGAWADRLRNELVPEKRVRPLRGSHLVVAHARLPVQDSLTLLHPQDRRPVFVFPWEGRTVIGTTDLDHGDDLDVEAAITRAEVEYLYDAVASQFGGARLTDADVISTWSGVRPVIASDAAARAGAGKPSVKPSKERRDHAVWANDGLITVSGGKLTTFRLIALDALRAAQPWLNREVAMHDDGRAVFAPAPAVVDLAEVPTARRRLLGGRYGAALTAWCRLEGATGATFDGTPYALADVLWSLRHEQVQHLDDLLLRRTRLGNLLPQGARSLLPLLRPHAQRELDWDDARWDQEVVRYLDIWQRYYGVPA